VLLSAAMLSGLPLCALPALRPAHATTYDVTIVDFRYVPAELTVQVGDRVIWTSDFIGHTVTSGTGDTDPAAGALFDTSIDFLSPTTSYTFATPGDVPYFCRPHAYWGMTGVVHVQAPAGLDAPPWPPPRLSPAYPNPFNPQTALSLSLPAAARVRLSVHDGAGRLVALLADATLEAGEHVLVWDGSDQRGRPVASGVYTARLVVNGYSQSGALRHMVLVR
jgi:plastocyanin